MYTVHAYMYIVHIYLYIVHVYMYIIHIYMYIVHSTCIHVHNTCIDVMRLVKQEVNVTNLFLTRSSQCFGPSVILKAPGETSQ